MGGLLPFQFPGATALYLLLYLVTLGLHFLAMHYVFAGTALLAWRSLFGRRSDGQPAEPLAETLRDWMPFALGAAITAGVAPLLFVQVLYAESFYTANLLLFHRWMIILPVLIAGFYLLYLGKSRAWTAGGRLLRLAAGAGPFLLFAFVAWSWTENHLLGLRGQEEWAAFYAANDVFYASREVPLRVGIWLAAAFPSMSGILALQLRGRRDLEPRTVRALATIALGGLAAFLILAAAWFLNLDAAGRERIGGAGTQLCLFTGPIGLVLQAGAWAAIRQRGLLGARLLVLAWLGLLGSLFSWVWIREGMRIAALDMDALTEVHSRTAEAGGLPVFLLFFLLNAGLIGLVLRLARRAPAGAPGA